MNRIFRNRWLFWGWFFASASIYAWVLLGPYGDKFGLLAVRLAILAVPVAISMIFIQSIWKGINRWTTLIVTLIGYGVLYEIFVFLPGINSYPFTLTWSEGTAYYFASLFFAERIYGIEVDLPLINPTRHMLMAIPFLVPDLPIWVHRLWEVLLWLSITGLTIFLFVRRLDIGDKLMRAAFFSWVFLYLFQGPVYYFLLISLIPVLWGFEGKNFKKTLLLVLIGSIWAGASRVNWIPIPALVAAALYFLEETVNKGKWKHYLRYPIGWFVGGTIIALLSWYAYAAWSGKPLGDFGIYFSSHLLWYRLFPNATLKSGVILTGLVASIPLLGLITIYLYKTGFNYHFIRRLGIGAILAVLFLGGLIVSTKIGGGNNIHNLDGYLLILLMTASYLYFGKTMPDFNFLERESPHRLLNIFVTLAVLLPVLYTFQGGKSVNLPNTAKVENALLTIQEFSAAAADDGGQVLFIGERQLLTFGEISGIPLVPEYERMNLMEMVMGGNDEYLDEFYERIENQEYALIITEPLKLKYKGRSVPFGDENDVYVRDVAGPVLCYYELIKDISRMPIQLLVPKSEPDNCS